MVSRSSSHQRNKKRHSSRDEEKTQTPLEIQFDRLIQSVDEDESLGDRTAEKRRLRAEYKQQQEQQQQEQQKQQQTMSSTSNNLFTPSTQHAFSFGGLSEPMAADPPDDNEALARTDEKSTKDEEHHLTDDLPGGIEGDENVQHADSTDLEQQEQPTADQGPTISQDLEEAEENEQQEARHQTADSEPTGPRALEEDEAVKVEGIRGGEDKEEEEEEDEIIFVAEDDEDDDGTRDRLVTFVGLPENPPELTAEIKFGINDDIPVTVDIDAHANNVEAELVAHSGYDSRNVRVEDEPLDEAHFIGEGEEGYLSQDFFFGTQQSQQVQVGGETLVFFEEEEEEEESDDDSSAERPPIPVEVMHSADEDESEYNTDLEFDASDDSSVEQLITKTPVVPLVDTVVIKQEEGDDDNMNMAAEAEDSGNSVGEFQAMNSAPHLEEDVEHGDHLLGAEGGQEGEHTERVMLEDEEEAAPYSNSEEDGDEPPLRPISSNVGEGMVGGSPDKLSASKEQPILPADDPEPQDDGVVERERKRLYLVLLMFLVCCSIAAAIAVPLLLKKSDDESRTSGLMPTSTIASSSNLPSYTPSLRPSLKPSDATLSPSSSDATLSPSTSRPKTAAPTSDIPNNDSCNTATGPLQPNGAVVTGSIASTGSNKVDRCGTDGSIASTDGPGVWFYTMGTGGEMMAHTCQNTNFDTKITIFEGDCDKPLCIDSNDNFCGPTNSFSAVSWQSEFQQVYRILVYGDSNFSGTGDFELALVSRYNDECTTAYGPLPVTSEDSGSAIRGGTLSANPNEIPCNDQVSNSPSVFYLVRGTGGTLTASVCDSADFGANIAILHGTCPTGLTCLNRTQASSCSISWETIPFQDYYLMIDGETEDDIGNFELKVTTSNVPDNNACNLALGPLPLDGSLVPGTTTGASVDSDAPFCDTAVSSPGVWYSVVGNGYTIQASLCGAANYDTRLSIYEGSCPTGSLESLVCVEGNDDFCGNESLVTWPSEEGKQYFILVHGYQEGVGDFQLSVVSIP